MAKKKLSVSTRVQWEPWAPSTTPPQCIIDDIVDCRITPEQGDAELVRLGLEPTERKPIPEAFDPSSEEIWTLVMVVTWIRWRSLVAVREMWPAYRQEFRFWVTYDYFTFPLGGIGPRAPRSHRRLEGKGVPNPNVELRNLPPPRHSEEAAFEQLRKRAEVGKLSGTGILIGLRDSLRREDALHRLVPSEHWASARLRFESETHGYAIGFKGLSADVCYEDVRLSSTEVRRLWPESGGIQSIDKKALGAKLKYNWNACEIEFLLKLDEDGLPTADSGDPKWVTQADAERWVHNWMQKRHGPDGKAPSESRVRHYISFWLRKFDQTRRGP